MEFVWTDDGVHILQLEEGRSAVVSISSPRLQKVLMSFGGGLRPERARAADHHPRRGTPSNTEHVEKNLKKQNTMRPLSGPSKLSVSLTITQTRRNRQTIGKFRLIGRTGSRSVGGMHLVSRPFTRRVTPRNPAVKSKRGGRGIGTAVSLFLSLLAGREVGQSKRCGPQIPHVADFCQLGTLFLHRSSATSLSHT